MTKYTDRDAIQLLERAVDERGADFVYPEELKGVDGGCRYANESGLPLCIVGVVASYLGVLSQLEEGAVAYNQEALGGIFNDAGMHILDIAQSHQDLGQTWGKALSEVRNRVQ